MCLVGWTLKSKVEIQGKKTGNHHVVIAAASAGGTPVLDIV